MNAKQYSEALVRKDARIAALEARDRLLSEAYELLEYAEFDEPDTAIQAADLRDRIKAERETS